MGIGTRAVRPRPILEDKPLLIVRNFTDLDNSRKEQNGAALDSGAAGGSNGTLPAGVAPEDMLPPPVVDSGDGAHPEGEEPATGSGSEQPAAHAPPHPPAAAAVVPKDIPVPEIRQVPSYTRDYLPLHKQGLTYIRGRGGHGHRDDGFVQYDLDNGDEDWLQQYCQGQNVLTPEQLELLITRLEYACADVIARSAGAVSDRQSAAASMEHMPRYEALAVMRLTGPFRDPVLEAVYSYWVKKRKKLQKPLVRTLQAPTPLADSNPFHVFRPREKVHRPQTRRRRETAEDCLMKMSCIKHNLKHALDVLDQLVRREKKKRDITVHELEAQQLRVRLRHEPPDSVPAMEADAEARLKLRKRSMVWDFPDLDDAAADEHIAKIHAQFSPVFSLEGLVRNKQKRRKRDRAGPVPVSSLPPPPPTPQEPQPFACASDLQRLDLTADPLGARYPAEGLQREERHARLGRNGRVWLDMLDPFTDLPIDEAKKEADAVTAHNAAPLEPSPALLLGMGGAPPPAPNSLPPPLAAPTIKFTFKPVA